MSEPIAAWKESNVLVTGAGGFVGAWLVQALAGRAATVVALLHDRQPVSGLEALGCERQAVVVHGSVTGAALMDRLLNRYEIDTVFHLAAQPIVGAANRSPVPTFEANIRGTWTVLEACRRCPTIRRVVVASSDKAYGDHAQLPYTEDYPLLGLNPYDASKACADVLARSYHRAFRTPVGVVRCANIYGGGDLNFSRVVPGTIRSALRGEDPIVRSDGTPIREYLYVGDAVSAYLSVAERLEDPEVAGQALNFGTGLPTSVLDLVRATLVAAGRPDLKPRILGSGKLEGEIDRQYLSSERARRILGWSPAESLESGLKKTVLWYSGFLGNGRSGGAR
jgi:CDP-glucose 4,6-dehydratase